jgi:hypothetical protein
MQAARHHDFEERLQSFVRLKKTFFEVCFFVRRTVEDLRIRRVYPLSTRSAHIHIRHLQRGRIGRHWMAA